ncbi:MAG: UDP-glucose:(heptosyl)LPS alpha-1,3-glucosyltransferase [Planctomycetota bacterium]|jgi:UDP-glucose:(heptosyl)LPS alpha-1,3-glucosyltransferase
MNTNRKLRIACAVVRYFQYGGMQRTYRRILSELRARGHEVTALVVDWEGDEVDGVEVQRLGAAANSNHGKNAAFGEAVRKWKSDHDIDVLVGFNKIPGLDVYYAGDPCFADFYARRPWGFMHRLTPRYRGMRSLESSVFEWGGDTEILMISSSEKSRFQAHYDTEEKRFHMLPPGIDRDRLGQQLQRPSDRIEFIKSIGLDPNDKMIVTIGSGFHTKGIDRVLKSVAALPTSLDSFYSVAIVGEGDQQKYSSLAKRLGIEARCVFLGPRDDVVNFYRHAELLVHPARIENTGTTLIEAMYCGLPVLTTANCGFAHHIIQANAGIVCPEPFESKVFDGLLLGALLAPQRRQWRDNGAKYSRQNDLYSLIERAADVICKVGCEPESPSE